jgi:hypothetical protein
LIDLHYCFSLFSICIEELTFFVLHHIFASKNFFLSTAVREIRINTELITRAKYSD